MESSKGSLLSWFQLRVMGAQSMGKSRNKEHTWKYYPPKESESWDILNCQPIMPQEKPRDRKSQMTVVGHTGTHIREQ